ncbi:hypothetical protein FHG87_007594 [Trinorchestia longiramus]|nr:hypothetical protein FHG87_007594 [Trinorchestia longiramus]
MYRLSQLRRYGGSQTSGQYGGNSKKEQENTVASAVSTSPSTTMRPVYRRTVDDSAINSRENRGYEGTSSTRATNTASSNASTSNGGYDRLGSSNYGREAHETSQNSSPNSSPGGGQSNSPSYSSEYSTKSSAATSSSQEVRKTSLYSPYNETENRSTNDEDYDAVAESTSSKSTTVDRNSPTGSELSKPVSPDASVESEFLEKEEPEFPKVAQREPSPHEKYDYQKSTSPNRNESYSEGVQDHSLPSESEEEEEEEEDDEEEDEEDVKTQDEIKPENDKGDLKEEEMQENPDVSDDESEQEEKKDDSSDEEVDSDDELCPDGADGDHHDSGYDSYEDEAKRHWWVADEAERHWWVGDEAKRHWWVADEAERHWWVGDEAERH